MKEFVVTRVPFPNAGKVTGSDELVQHHPHRQAQECKTRHDRLIVVVNKDGRPVEVRCERCPLVWRLMA